MPDSPKRRDFLGLTAGHNVPVRIQNRIEVLRPPLASQASQCFIYGYFRQPG
jgi:hypothetical protein